MDYITEKDIAQKWGVSKRMLRKYCTQNQIPNAYFENDTWYIPEDMPKPKRESKKAPEVVPPPLVKKIQYQRKKNNHFGIYEYIQVNLAYGSNRMASNRLTRKQIAEMYRTHRITPAFEGTKVDDIREVVNHFICVQYMVDTIMAPVTQTLIKKYHMLLTYGTDADWQKKLVCGEYRTNTDKLGIVPAKIAEDMSSLIKEYESSIIDLNRILDFHVRFEKIHPFADYNGRVGRIIMVKECLRHGIDLFIIDDKHRGPYNHGIAAWSKDKEMLETVAKIAQERLQGHMKVCKLMEYNRSL